MIISADLIRSLVDSHSLILPGEPLAHYTEQQWGIDWIDRMANIEGHSFDCRLRKVFVIDGQQQPEIGENYRVTPKVFEVQPQPGKDGILTWMLRPAFYLLQTVETFKMPDFLTGVLDARTTVFRSACKLATAVLHPGYDGVLTIGIDVEHPQGLRIEQGARFMTVRFMPIMNDATEFVGLGEDESYRGIWSGDKVSTDGEVERGY